MKRIKKKLHSQSGASFLFALLAFLVAAMVSVTIVAAAVTTVQRVNSDREAQQAQLTLISAAQLVRDEMEETRYIITTTTTVTKGKDNEDIVTTKVNERAEGTFKAEIEDAVKYVKDYEHLEPYKADPAFQITVAGSGFEMKPVNVSFAMKTKDGEKYHLVFTLSIDRTMDSTEEKLFLKMTTPGIQEKSNDGSTKIEEIEWSDGVIDGIGDTNESKT